MRMKPGFAFLFCAAAAVAAPVRPAIETSLRGASGVEAKFTILAVWADGFHVRQAGHQPPLFVAWDKVDVDWLAEQRPEISALMTSAKPFPRLDAATARAKLDAAKKQFRAPRTFTYGAASAVSVTSQNYMAEKYVAKLRTVTPINITQGLGQIITDYEQDVRILSGGTGSLDRLQLAWLKDTFAPYWTTLVALQCELDPVNAGAIEVPKTVKLFTPEKTDDSWFD